MPMNFKQGTKLGKARFFINDAALLLVQFLILYAYPFLLS